MFNAFIMENIEFRIVIYDHVTLTKIELSKKDLNIVIFFTENSVKSTNSTTKESSASNYLRNHHQPDLVKVSQSPKVVTSNAELARLEHILDEKNRENERLRARLGHNAKGFEALAVTVNHLAKKVNWVTTRLLD